MRRIDVMLTWHLLICEKRRRVRTTPKKFQNRGLTLKTRQIFPTTLRWKNLKTQLSPVILHLCLQSQRFQFNFPWIEELVRKAAFSWRTSVDRRLNPRNKAAFSNCSVTFWTVLKILSPEFSFIEHFKQLVYLPLLTAWNVSFFFDFHLKWRTYETVKNSTKLIELADSHMASM